MFAPGRSASRDYSGVGKLIAASLDRLPVLIEKFAEPFFLSDTDCKILADDPELAGNPVFSFRIHVTGEKLLAAINEVDALVEWLEPHLKGEKWRR